MAERTTADIPAGGDFPVSRVRNADEFRQQFRQICDDYEQLFRPRIVEVRTKYAKSPTGGPPSFVDESLEAHVRVYVVNALLAALNWRLDTKPEGGLPHLVPEAPVESLEKGSTRFLDYLGLERQTNKLLLVVETKRPSSPLPQLVDFPASSFPEILCQGLTGKPLMSEWSKWLATLRDYVRSLHTKATQPPKRVVMTNGDWLILFLDPDNAFVQEGTPDAGRVLVFEDRSDIEQRYGELYRYLEHGAVSGEIPGLMPAEIPFHVARDAVDRLLHGLRLRYIEQPGIYQPSPVIKVAPVIFIRSRYGAWLRVESPPIEYELPHQSDRLSAHLVEVQKAAKNLLCQVHAVLGNNLTASPLVKHYQDEDAFDPIRGIIECGRDEFLVVTGDKTHYLLPEPSVPQCPYHDWGRSNADGVAMNPSPIMRRSINPRSFFCSSEVHHCTHYNVAAAKASQITAENRLRCGPRSGQDGQAFCEIWSFESHLCCRTCAFEEVCTKAEVFHLPCQPPTSAKAISHRYSRRRSK
jgi:hypothetical protein